MKSTILFVYYLLLLLKVLYFLFNMYVYINICISSVLVLLICMHEILLLHDYYCRNVFLLNFLSETLFFYCFNIFKKYQSPCRLHLCLTTADSARNQVQALLVFTPNLYCILGQDIGARNHFEKF